MVPVVHTIIYYGMNNWNHRAINYIYDKNYVILVITFIFLNYIVLQKYCLFTIFLLLKHFSQIYFSVIINNPIIKTCAKYILVFI